MSRITGWFGKWLHGDAATEAVEAQPAAISTEQQPVSPVQVELPVWNEGLRIFDEFEVGRQLGSGGLGPVYLVRNTGDDRVYAVKRVVFLDDGTRNEFLAQLQTWVYLPEHPHLGACRFLRVQGNEVDVFDELMEGTCLKEVIRSKLYAGDEKTVLERILDIAIQMAWGLQALEGLKLVHGDLKPTDVFVSSKGIVRITGMGLARVIANAFRADGKPAEKPSRVYASPEVTDGGEITETSDFWCWGLNVFEMFAGVVTWGEAPPEPKKEEEEPDNRAKLTLDQLRAVGHVPEWGGRTGLCALETYLKGPAPEKPLPAMPNAVASILKRCFASRIGDRWNSASEVAQELRLAYRQLLGREHARRAPAALHLGNRLIIAHARWSKASGAQWLSIHEWGERIERAMGKPTAIGVRSSESSLGLKAQAQHDHVALYALQRRCEDLIASGHPELRHELAGLCIDHGFLHVGLQSIPKALECFDQAIQIWDELVHREQRDELKNELAMAYLNRGIALKQMGHLEEAQTGYEQAIKLWSDQITMEGRRELSATLGWAAASRAKVLFKLAMKSRGNALNLGRLAQELQSQAQEQSAETRALRSRINTLRANIDKLGSLKPPATGTGSAGPAGPTGETPTQHVERDLALQAARAELVSAEESLKAAEELEAQAKAKQQEASATDAGSKALQKYAETEARTALNILQAEVKRTDREDARAVLHWAQRAFEGLL